MNFSRSEMDPTKSLVYGKCSRKMRVGRVNKKNKVIKWSPSFSSIFQRPYIIEFYFRKINDSWHNNYLYERQAIVGSIF